MTTLYKLTDSNGLTRAGKNNECQWGENVTHKAQAKSGGLCSDQYIHAYLNPHLALLLNPIHANIANPRLWEAKGRIAARDGQLKVGCKSLTTIREIPVPVITTEQRAVVAILCAKAVYQDKAWNAWADAWLNGAHRSKQAADAAAEAAEAATYAATEAAYAAEAAAGVDLFAIVAQVFPESHP